MSTHQLYSLEVATVYDEVSALFKRMVKAVYTANLPNNTRIEWVNKIHAAMARGTACAQLLDLENVKKEWEGR